MEDGELLTGEPVNDDDDEEDDDDKSGDADMYVKPFASGFRKRKAR